MVGISYWNQEHARMIKDSIIDAYKFEGHENLFWDEIVDRLLDKMEVQIYEVFEKSIVEIDTVEELNDLEKQLAMKGKVEDE